MNGARRLLNLDVLGVIMGFIKVIMSEHIDTVFLSTSLSPISMASSVFVLQDNQFMKRRRRESKKSRWASKLSSLGE